MKQLSITLLALMAFWLAGCTVEEIENDNPKPGTKSGLTLSAQIKQRTAGTKAVGDPFTAAKEEKRIDRIAFFVHTDEDGFQVYPPVPDADATGDRDAMRKQYPNNVYLWGNVDAGYQAEVSLTAGGGYNADIIAVANLPADYDYRQILTWKGLQDSVTVWNTTMPACLPGSDTELSNRNALAMYGYCTKELAKEETNPISFEMERLVARIDITNEAYVSGATPDNHGADVLGQSGFLLTSVKLLRAKPAAYLVPKPETPDVETTSDWAPLVNPGTDILYGKPTAADATANPTREPDKVEVAAVNTATLQYAWHTLYTYPNDDAKHAPTALEIKGWFKGTEITRQIPFVDKDKKAFPILGNHRYLVRIAKAPGQTDLNYSITVSEWDTVDTVNVKPNQSEVPVITKIDGNGAYARKKKRYDVYYTQAGEISFDATCPFAPDIRVKYDEKQYGNWLTVEKSEPELITKAANVYKRHFKVTFPGMTEKGIRNAMLLVHNGGSEVECDTVFIRHTIYYPGTDLEGIPVEKNGVTTIWAPVNCGAMRLPTEIYWDRDWKNNKPITLTPEQKQSNLEQMGYCYQWGRKVPFEYPGFIQKMPNSILVRTEGDYGVYDEASTPGYRNDAFIASPYDDTPYKRSWFAHPDKTDPAFPASIKDAGYTWPRPYDPCPYGWHVAGKSDWQTFIDVVGTERPVRHEAIWNVQAIPGFIIPYIGNIDFGGNGESQYPMFFISDFSDGAYVGHIELAFFSLMISNTFSSYGLSVRCVQE